jgi:hypothetical protein
MGIVSPLPAAPHPDDQTIHEAPSADQAANLRFIDDATCALCGARLTAASLHYHVVSPQSSETRLAVCHLCRKAALGEGYRPA